MPTRSILFWSKLPFHKLLINKQKYIMGVIDALPGTTEAIHQAMDHFMGVKDFGSLPKIVKTKEPKLPMKGKKNILITSALPYVNNVSHLGTIVGCVLSADVYSRFCRARGYNTIYICGTDEYGTATETRAIEEGLSPRQICDKYFKIHKETYEWFNIEFDFFGRTTTEHQTRFLADRFVGGTCPTCAYEDARGDQCDKCGKLLNPTDLQKPRCEICRSSPALRSSNHVFLNLKQIAENLKSHLYNLWSSESCHWSLNAINISKSWLKDLKPRCLTRDLKWGTPVPLKNFEQKVFYVWFDAPIGYISMTAQYTAEWEKWWKNPEEVELKHFLGNVVFHSIIFPCSLIGTGDPYTMVNSISATEFLNYEDTKFSKSRGIGVFGSDTMATGKMMFYCMKDLYRQVDELENFLGIPPDFWRFYLCYVRPETSYASFAWSDFALRVNSELVNNVGNFVLRALTFVKKFFDGMIPEMLINVTDGQVLAEINVELKDYVNLLDCCRLRDALKCALAISRIGNQYIQSSQPWALVKGSEEERKRAGSIVALASNICSLLSIMLRPYLPATSDVLNKQLNLPQLSDCLIPKKMVKILPDGHTIGEVFPLFQLLDPVACENFRSKYGGQRNDIANGVSEMPPDSEKVEKSPTKKLHKNVDKSEKQPKQSNTKSGNKVSDKPSTAQKSFPQLTENIAQNEAVLQECVEKLDEELNNLLLKFGADQEVNLINEKVQLDTRTAYLKRRLIEAECKSGVPQYYDFLANEEIAQKITEAYESESGSVANLNVILEKVSLVSNDPDEKTQAVNQQGKKEKGVKKDQPKVPTKNVPTSEEKVDVSRLDIRVGRIIKVEEHPNADSLYVETIDIGDEKPRTVISGLVKHVPIQEMQNRFVLLLCNLKPTKMRGIESQAMVLCASTPEKVEILSPPPGVVPGDRVTVPGYDGSPDVQLNLKKKTWEKIQPDLMVDGSGIATFKCAPWKVGDKGEVKSMSLRNAPIK